MRRVVWWLGGAILLGGLWLKLLSISELEPSTRAVIEVLPLWALVAFGCYSLAYIGYEVAVFPTCDREVALLQKDIVEARTELAKLGIVVGNS
eukprot:jgi/Chlat1/5454/Chrsp36S05446